MPSLYDPLGLRSVIKALLEQISCGQVVAKLWVRRPGPCDSSIKRNECMVYCECDLCIYIVAPMSNVLY